MKIVTTEEFSADCLAIIDKVCATGEAIIIAKNNKNIAKLVPIPKEHDILGALKGSVYYEGDIISPIDVEWNVLKDD